MNSSYKFIIGVLVGLVFGFGSGFFFANSANRQEIENLRAENGRLKSAPKAQADNDKLSDEEIRAKIAEADASPNNLDFQKKLAFALYAYSTSQNETKFLPDIDRLLRRILPTQTKDAELLIALGNINFDLAQNGEKSKFQDARDFYAKALAINPKLAEVRTDLGLSYFLDEPSAPEKALAEYEKSLKIEPKNEKTLQNIVSALIALKKIPEAEKRLNELRAVNANNPSLADLQTQIAQAKVSN